MKKILYLISILPSLCFGSAIFNPGTGSGGGGSSSLAVGTGTASNFTTSVTSPTAAISFLGSEFRSVASGTTNFIQLEVLDVSSGTVRGTFYVTDSTVMVTNSDGTPGVKLLGIAGGNGQLILYNGDQAGQILEAGDGYMRFFETNLRVYATNGDEVFTVFATSTTNNSVLSIDQQMPSGSTYKSWAVYKDGLTIGTTIQYSSATFGPAAFRIYGTTGTTGSKRADVIFYSTSSGGGELNGYQLFKVPAQALSNAVIYASTYSNIGDVPSIIDSPLPRIHLTPPGDSTGTGLINMLVGTNGVNLSSHTIYLGRSDLKSLYLNGYDCTGQALTAGSDGFVDCISLGSGGGGYSLQPATVTIQANLGIITSTLAITSASPGVLHIVAGSSQAVTMLVSMSTETTGVFLASATAGSSMLISGTNNVNNAAPIFNVNFSSAISRTDAAALYQPLDATLTDLAAAPLSEDNSIAVGAIAAGVLPTDVIASSANATMLVSSFPVVNGNVGSFTNANITVNAQGFVTAASNGTGGTGSGSYSTVQFASTNSVTVSATTTETSLKGIGVGTTTISAGTLTAGKTFNLRVGGIVTADSLNGTPFELKVKVNGTTVAVTNSGCGMNGYTNTMWFADILFTVRATGASGSVQIEGDIPYGNNSTVYSGCTITNLSTAPFNTTINNDIDFAVKWGDSDSDNSITSQQFVLDMMNTVNPTQHFSVTIATRSAGWANDQIPVWRAPVDTTVTISSINACTFSVAASTLTFNIEERSLINTTGTDIFTVANSTANNTCVTYNSFANAGIAAGAHLVVDFDGSPETGTVEYLNFTVYYRKD